MTWRGGGYFPFSTKLSLNLHVTAFVGAFVGDFVGAFIKNYLWPFSQVYFVMPCVHSLWIFPFPTPPLNNRWVNSSWSSRQLKTNCKFVELTRHTGGSKYSQKNLSVIFHHMAEGPFVKLVATQAIPVGKEILASYPLYSEGNASRWECKKSSTYSRTKKHFSHNKYNEKHFSYQHLLCRVRVKTCAQLSGMGAQYFVDFFVFFFMFCCVE